MTEELPIACAPANPLNVEEPVTSIVPDKARLLVAIVYTKSADPVKVLESFRTCTDPVAPPTPVTD